MKWSALVRGIRRKPWSNLFASYNILPFVAMAASGYTDGVRWWELLGMFCYIPIWVILVIIVLRAKAEGKIRYYFIGGGILIFFMLPILFLDTINLLKEKLYFYQNQKEIEELILQLRENPYVSTKIDSIKIRMRKMDYEETSNCKLEAKGYVRTIEFHTNTENYPPSIKAILIQLKHLGLNSIYLTPNHTWFIFSAFIDNANGIVYTNCPEMPQENGRGTLRSWRHINGNWYHWITS